MPRNPKSFDDPAEFRRLAGLRLPALQKGHQSKAGDRISKAGTQWLLQELEVHKARCWRES